MKHRIYYIFVSMLIAISSLASNYSFQSNYGMKFAWQENDEVGIYTISGTRIPGSVISMTNNNTASVYLGGWSIVESSQYYAYSPYTSEYYINKYPISALPVSYQSQIQGRNNDTNHLSSFDYMMSSFTTSTSSAYISYNHLGSIIRIEWVVPETKTITKLSLSTDNDVFVTDAVMNLPAQKMELTAKTNEITLSLDDVYVEKEGALVAYIMVAPVDLSGKTLTATLRDKDGAELKAKLSGANILAGKTYPIQIGIENIEGMELSASKAVVDLASATSITTPSAYAPDFLIDTQNSITVYGDVLLGDVDGNGVVDAIDAIALNGYYLNGQTSNLDKKKCDVNKDNKIDVLDVIAITSKYINGK